MVYFIKLEETSFVRIGFTNDLEGRVRNLKSSNPHKIRVIGTCEGERQMESYYHSAFKNLHVHGDWFREGPELKKFLESRFCY